MKFKIHVSQLIAKMLVKQGSLNQRYCLTTNKTLFDRT